MNLPDAPIAQEGLFAAYLFTVMDQQIEELPVRILSGELINPENPCSSSWRIRGSSSIAAIGPTSDEPEVFLETSSDLKRVMASLICTSPTSGPATKNGDTRERSFLPSDYPILTAGKGAVTCVIRGYLIEVGQYTQLTIDWLNKHSNVACGKQEDVRSCLGSSHEGICSAVRRAIKSGELHSAVPDEDQSSGKYIDEEAAEEVLCGNNHDLLPPPWACLLPAEEDTIV